MTALDAAGLFGRVGTYNSASQVPFARIPSDAEREAALGHQALSGLDRRTLRTTRSGHLRA